MRGPSAVRVLAIGSIGAAAAVAAHGGPDLADPGWLLPALAAALGCTWACACGALLAGRGVAARPWSLWTTAGLLLAAQTAAHVTLLALGVMPAGGQAGAVALHVLLALAGAVLWSHTERAFARCAADVRRAWLRFAGFGTPAAAWPGRAPQPVPARAPRHLRGPPCG
jgi:hypothetical protein